MRSEIIKPIVAFFSISFLFFGSNLLIMSYSQSSVPSQGQEELSPQLQQQQPQLQQQGLSANMTTLLPGGPVAPISPTRPPVGLPSPPPPQQHISSESEVGARPCVVSLNRFLNLKSADVGRIFPEWKPVNDPVNRILAVLEGRVTDAEVAFHDVPISHYSHDMTFDVRPDATPDNRYTNLLGVQIDPKTGKPTTRNRGRMGIRSWCSQFW
jgi:hypothetical protein